MRPYFEEIVQNESANNALEFVYKLEKEEQISDCHVPAHWIGEANLLKYNNDAGLALATCSPGCIEGCQHGVIEKYTQYNDIQSVANVCSELESVDRILYRQCLHGLGHGVMRHGQLTYTEANNVCDTLDTEFEKDTCMGGADMEFFDQFIELGEKEFKRNINTICEKEKETEYFDACVVGVGYGSMVVTGHRTYKAIKLCELFEEEKDRELCTKGVIDEEKVNRKDIETRFSF